MPIVGLTDQPPKFTEIGRLRKGEKKTQEDRPGRDLTYFRPDFNEREEKAAAMFHEAYGDEPREVNILLPFDDVDKNLYAWRTAYRKGGLLHKCDGVHVNYAVDPESGEVLVQDGKDADGNPVKCDGQPITHWTDKKGKQHPVYCEPSGLLFVIIPELRRLACMTVVTTSTWDVLNLSSQLEAIKAMNRGKLCGIPLVLKRRPYMKSTPGPNGKRMRRKIWLLSIEADPDWVDAQLTALKMATLPNGDAILKLPPGVPDTNNGNGDGVEGEVSYEIEGEGQVWKDERPVYEAESIQVEMPKFRNMNEFYVGAQDHFKYTDKKDVVKALTNVLGTTVLEAQKSGAAMTDLWAILVEIEEANLQDLDEDYPAVDYDGEPLPF